MTWLVVLAAGIASYALRAGLPAWGVELPASFERRLRHGGPAVVAALVASSLTRPAPSPGLAAELLAVAAAFAATSRFRTVAAAPVAGLLVLGAMAVLIPLVTR